MDDNMSNNLKDTLEAVDAKIEEYQADIERGKALDSLMKQPLFKTVILDGYFEAEANKLFNILIDPSGASPYSNEEIQLKLAAISHFKSYVGTSEFDGTVKMNAKNAQAGLLAEEIYRDEVTAQFAASGE